MNKVIERGWCAVTWVIERLIIICVEKWADLIRLLKFEESTESEDSNLGCGGQPYGCSRAFRLDWNSTGTFVTNLEMKYHMLDSASVRQFLGKNDSNTRYAGLVRSTLLSLLYRAWVRSSLPRAFPTAPADTTGLPWEEGTGKRDTVQNLLNMPLGYVAFQYKGETGTLCSTLDFPKCWCTRTADADLLGDATDVSMKPIHIMTNYGAGDQVVKKQSSKWQVQCMCLESLLSYSSPNMSMCIWSKIHELLSIPAFIFCVSRATEIVVHSYSDFTTFLIWPAG